MSDLPRPSDFELAILRVLWRLGPATVRQVHDGLRGERELGYTTVLKTMQIMVDKGLLLRDAQVRSHIYRPAVAADQTRRDLARDLADRAFGGSALQLLMHALEVRRPSRQELEDIQSLLDRVRSGRGRP